MHISDRHSPLFAGLDESLTVWMSHGDSIEEMPPGFKALAHTENTPNAAIGNDKGMFGIQFHPEVVHTPQGKEILKNFAYNICGCKGNWTMGNFINENIAIIKKQVGNGKVIAALSGGVDSAVVASLLHKAIGNQLTCIFVNNGLLRREEVERTFNTFRLNMGMNIIYVDATDRFLNRLKGVIDPETETQKHRRWNSSVFLKKKPPRWAKWIFWRRARFIRTSSKALPPAVPPPRKSKPITMSAGCRQK